jgi:hypothetical protein
MGKIAAMLTSALRQDKPAAILFVALAMSLGFAGCTLLNPFEPLPASKRTSSGPTSPVLHGEKETFTGKVVLATEGYRLKLSDSEESVRLTRAKRASEFAKDEVGLRKYYEKTLAVRGKREGEWLWDAEIVGQWNKPGESQGPNFLAPPAGGQ